jgi:hypothetical protein
LAEKHGQLETGWTRSVIGMKDQEGQQQASFAHGISSNDGNNNGRSFHRARQHGEAPYLIHFETKAPPKVPGSPSRLKAIRVYQKSKSSTLQSRPINVHYRLSH